MQALRDGTKLYFPSRGENLSEGIAEVKSLADKGTYAFVYGRMVKENEFLPIEDAIRDGVVDPEGLAEVKFCGVRLIYDERNCSMKGYVAKTHELEDIVMLNKNSPAYVVMRVKGLIRKVTASEESSYRLPDISVVEEYYRSLGEDESENGAEGYEETEGTPEDMENDCDEAVTGEFDDANEEVRVGVLEEESSDDTEELDKSASEESSKETPKEKSKAAEEPEKEDFSVSKNTGKRYIGDLDNDPDTRVFSTEVGVSEDAADEELVGKVRNMGIENIVTVKLCNNRLVKVVYNDGEEKSKFFLLGSDGNLTEVG